jgi:hypothetical protein
MRPKREPEQPRRHSKGSLLVAVAVISFESSHPQGRIDLRDD